MNENKLNLIKDKMHQSELKAKKSLKEINMQTEKIRELSN